MKCPYCNKSLEIEDEIEISTIDEETISTVIGKCNKCNRVFVWDDVYKYSHSTNLSEIK